MLKLYKRYVVRKKQIQFTANEHSSDWSLIIVELLIYQGQKEDYFRPIKSNICY